MKKLILILSMVTIFLTNSISFATENSFFGMPEEPIESSEVEEMDTEDVVEEETTIEEEQVETQKETVVDSKQEEKTENKVETATEKTAESEMTPASKKIIENTSKKDRKIAEYMEKYGDKTYAYTAYYLDMIQLYSIPVCIIGITIGAFNFYIIGEKKLDKREKGFSFIMAFLCGLVFFQVLPLIFALLVAGK